jgi:hypothetical protein
MVPDDCGAIAGASGADRTHSYSASICLLVARACFAGKQERSKAIRPIARCYRGRLAGRRWCLNIATDSIAASFVLGCGRFARTSTRVANRVRCLRIFKCGLDGCARDPNGSARIGAKRWRIPRSTPPALRMWPLAGAAPSTSGKCRRRRTPAPCFALAQTANSKTRRRPPGCGAGPSEKRAWETRKVCDRTNTNAWEMSTKVQKRISGTFFLLLLRDAACI